MKKKLPIQKPVSTILRTVEFDEIIFTTNYPIDSSPTAVTTETQLTTISSSNNSNSTSWHEKIKKMLLQCTRRSQEAVYESWVLKYHRKEDRKTCSFCAYKHLVHSLIFNLGDIVWTNDFSSEGLAEIKVTIQSLYQLSQKETMKQNNSFEFKYFCQRFQGYLY